MIRRGSPGQLATGTERIGGVKYRQLGYTGLRVSELALGTMTFGGHDKFAHVGATEVEEAWRIVDIAIDGGVNLIDTDRRDEIVLATKARFAMGNTGNGC